MLCQINISKTLCISCMIAEENNSATGADNEIFEYLAPLAIELDGKEYNKDYSPHVSPYLVFEQQERVSL